LTGNTILAKFSSSGDAADVPMLKMWTCGRCGNLKMGKSGEVQMGRGGEGGHDGDSSVVSHASFRLSTTRSQVRILPATGGGNQSIIYKSM